ncbi:hypothetical protein [Gemmata obscuriglobus]|uniref:hypothetical protein n=1 Tax=Gemmata obscuriglobus TaxID=114 RepID=UPI0011CE0C05|nr:hypothetical protein [Gemmata obscuriglobus]
MPRRSVQEVIDQAIGEGRRWERLCYALVLFFIALGSIVLIVGVVRESGLLALDGSLFTGLFWPALRYADGVRRDLIRTRMYEMALAKAKTPAEMLEMLREVAGAGNEEKPQWAYSGAV